MRSRETLFRIWLSPRQGHFLIAILGVLAIFAIRLGVTPLVGSRLPLLWFSLPIAIAAFIGGLWPGISATVLSLSLGIITFVLPSAEFRKDVGTGIIQIISFSFVWIFISIVCDLMRNTAMDFRNVATERDEGRRQISSILGGVSDGFCAVDRNYMVLLTNRAFRSLFGAEAGNVEGALLWQIMDLAPDSHVKSELDIALATGKPVMFDHQINADGRWFHIRGFPNSDGLFVYVQDITARKSFEESREQLLAEEKQARTEAEQASRLKDEFVATVSHELRTPLTAILGWSEILASRAENAENPELAEGLRAIERSTRLQAQLIDDLLDMSRITNGKLQLNVEVVDLSEVVKLAIQSCLNAAEQRSIKIHADYGEDDMLVRGDHSRLIQIFANLVSNAVKFSSKGGQLWVKITNQDSLAVITVKDEGIGIDADNLPIIFDRFRQANATITRRHGGLGLGLSIVKQLTELHGGSVEVQSEGTGKGSLFIVKLPVAPFPNASDTVVPKPTKIGARVDGLRIMVVDDDDATRKLLTVVLKDAGASVVMARSAFEALDEFQRTDLDLIVSDIGMPEMDGYQLIESIRSTGSTVPAIALTAFSRTEDRERALDSGFNEHMAKPVDVNRLLAAVVAHTPKAAS